MFPTDATFGGVLELHGLTYSYTNSTTLTIAASSVTLFPGKTFQATFAGLSGTYNTQTQAFALTGSSMVMNVGDALTVKSTTVGFDYTPAIG